MEPTPALWALLRCTCSPVARRMPSCTETERCEKEAIRSSFHPAGREEAVRAPDQSRFMEITQGQSRIGSAGR